ncbi:sensor histidine kinase [Streptomyces sp. RKND-216]|uniref:sensor histidine kinase n=1 Tax=Streptomyces sp. RKND-216 TaxID=2562581 RepID=UPI001445C61B|nr:sensor histidine kinase [Streptomyces sp. RKND-216]
MAQGLLGRESRDDVVHVLGTLALSPLYVLPAVLFVSGVALTPVFLIGVPLLPVAMVLAGLVARAEQARHGLQPATSDRVPEGTAVAPGWRDRTARLFGRRSWKRLGFSAALSLWGLGAGAVVVTLLAAGALLALLPLLFPLLPAGATLLGLDATSPAVAFAACLPGLAMLSAGWRLPRHLMHAEVLLVSRLLGSGTVDHLVRRVLDLEDSRSRMVDAAEEERRRIERNLHDGAQQRLLSVAMTLGRAKSRFARDPEKALLLLTTAHEDAKAAMQELRDVTRGLHPAILQEQGLEDALLSVVARSPVPVDLRVQLTARCSPRAEAVAYYVISEALTNVAKHAAADAVTVKVLRQGDLLRIAVADDGIGGADPARGTGLRGLSDRVHAVDGHLTCTSPFGGPTVVDATIPWEA